jgi:hypothetical protein
MLQVHPVVKKYRFNYSLTNHTPTLWSWSGTYCIVCRNLVSKWWVFWAFKKPLWWSQALLLKKTSIRLTILPWTDCNIQLQTFVHTTGSAGINFWITNTLYRSNLRPHKTELFDMPYSYPSWYEHFLGPISILTWMSSSLCSATACFGHHFFLSRMEPVSHPLLNNFRTQVFDGCIALDNAIKTYVHGAWKTSSLEEMSQQEIRVVPVCT